MITDGRCQSCKDGVCIVHPRTETVRPGDPRYEALYRKAARRPRRQRDGVPDAKPVAP